MTEPGATPRAQDFAERGDWPGYFRMVLGQPARETTIAAVEAFAREGVRDGFAIDLGAGEGRDTIELLSRGWHVLAIDGHAQAFEFMLPRVPEAFASQLTTRVARFDEMELPPCDLVNASFSLPFCAPEHFDALWARIVAAIRPGGRFAGQFFGDRDSWASLSGRSHFSAEQVRSLLEPFDVELCREDEKDDTPDVTRPKHWHVFHVVARKR